MAALAFRPHVAEFLDEVVHAEEFDVDIHELIVAPGSPAVGLTLADVLEGEHAAIVAVKDAAGRYALNPPPSRLLGAGDVLISIGSLDQLARLAAAVGTGPAAGRATHRRAASPSNGGRRPATRS